MRSSGGNGRDETILLKRQSWNQMMQLKDEAYLVPQQVQGGSPSLQPLPIYGDSAGGGLIERPHKMQQCAFAAAGRPAEGHGLPSMHRKVHSIEHADGVVFVALSDIFSNEDGTTAFIIQSAMPPLPGLAWHRPPDTERQLFQ